MKFDKTKIFTRVYLEEIGINLLQSLADFIEIELVTFREHYVQEGSFVLNFRSNSLLNEKLCLQIEGVLLFDYIKETNQFKINAEILLFSMGSRIAPRQYNGSGFIMLRYSTDDCAWEILKWVNDTEDDWIKISAPREEQYHKIIKTYDFDE